MKPDAEQQEGAGGGGDVNQDLGAAALANSSAAAAAAAGDDAKPPVEGDGAAAAKPGADGGAGGPAAAEPEKPITPVEPESTIHELIAAAVAPFRDLVADLHAKLEGLEGLITGDPVSSTPITPDVIVEFHGRFKVCGDYAERVRAELVEAVEGVGPISDMVLVDFAARVAPS